MSSVWALARRQHGLVTWDQLLALGYTPSAIRHRASNGRLHRVARGVYAIGRPETTRLASWMASVLSLGPEAVLSHGSAAALWQIVHGAPSETHVTLPGHLYRRRPGVRIHRRATLSGADRTTHQGIPVTSPACTLIDLATHLPCSRVEAAINEADKLDLIDPETLSTAVRGLKSRPGATTLGRILDRHTLVLTDSELERLFLPIVRRAGLPGPQTQQHVNGFRVDFYWPELGLVVETDGLRYHRTAAQQQRDRERDQAHAAAGLTCLRFTYAQVKFDPDHVLKILVAVAGRLSKR